MAAYQKGQQVGDWQFTGKIWKGTFGETWKAQKKNGEIVAVQLIEDSSFIAEMQRHPMDISPIAAPQVAQLVAVHQNPPAFVWSYFAGRRLSTFIKELGQLKVNIAVHIARKVLETLVATASSGMVHGALRPNRVLITSDKNVVLTNFGIGYWEQRILAQELKTPEHAGRFANIVNYFAPEVIEDQLFDDPKSDIYATGMILAEMLIGQKAERGQIPQLLANLQTKSQVTEIIVKAIADFEERYHHPRQMYQDLTRLVKPAKDNPEVIYVPPPNANRAKSITLEAIPADSEEYRVYQAQILSAKQTIDAEVVAAEPVDTEDAMDNSGFGKTSRTVAASFAYGEESSVASELPDKESAKSETRQEPPAIAGTEIGHELPRVPINRQQRAIPIATLTRRSHDPTTDNTILEHLGDQPIWPNIFGKYVAVLSLVLAALIALIWFVPHQHRAIPWLLLPLYTITRFPPIAQWANMTVLFAGIAAVALLPWLDSRGTLGQSTVKLTLLTGWLCWLLGLGIWGMFV